MKLWGYRKDEVTFEGIAGGERFQTTVFFTESVSVREIANLRVAFEAGVREGLLLAERVVRNTETDAQ